MKDVIYEHPLRQVKLQTHRAQKRLDNCPAFRNVLERRPGRQSTLDLPVVTKSGERIRYGIVG